MLNFGNNYLPTDGKFIIAHQCDLDRFFVFITPHSMVFGYTIHTYTIHSVPNDKSGYKKSESFSLKLDFSCISYLHKISYFKLDYSRKRKKNKK